MADVFWQPTASREALASRARHLQNIRNFFQRENVLEVSTPILSEYQATDVHLEQWRTDNGYALHTSPEYAMKRLLAAGYGDIFQICPVFRLDELSHRHNPEFTMLEWYRVGWDEWQLMREVVGLIECLAGRSLVVEYVSFQQAFLNCSLPDPFLATDQELRLATKQLLSSDTNQWTRDDCLDALMALVVEPSLPKESLVFIHSYPISQAALAAHGRYQNVAVGRRFELYWQGLELANGYFELTNPAEQQSRFKAEQAQRMALGLRSVELDQRFLAALDQGLPDCAGVALGIDRLIMLLDGHQSIEAVIAFPANRA